MGATAKIHALAVVVVTMAHAACSPTATVDLGPPGSGTITGPFAFPVQSVRADGFSATTDKADIQILDFDRCALADGGSPAAFDELELRLHVAEGGTLALGSYVVVVTSAGFTKTQPEAEAYLTRQGQPAGTGQSGTVVVSEIRPDGAAGSFDITIGDGPTGGTMSGTFNATACQ